MMTQNNGTAGTAAPVSGRRRLLLIGAAVALLLVAVGIIVAVVALERSSRSPADGAYPATQTQFSYQLPVGTVTGAAVGPLVS